MAKRKIEKILIAGDSFSCVWPNRGEGWSVLLSNEYNITNVSQAGVGEYKIFKQVKSANLTDFDLIIVSHTSPSRIHTNNHPIHKSGFHKDCDLIYNDLENRFSWFNKNLEVSKKWFEFHYDDEYQIDIYRLIREKINSLININYISITHTGISSSLSFEKNNIDFSNIWESNRGYVNHYSDHGNKLVYKKIKSEIEKI